MKNVFSILVGIVFTLSIGMANAEEPLTLNADQMDQVTAGGFAFVDVELIVTKFKDIFENVNKFVVKEVNAVVDVEGFLADAEAGANCFGFNCLAETLTITDSRADLFTATAFSESLSAATGLNGLLGP